MKLYQYGKDDKAHLVKDTGKKKPRKKRKPKK